MGGSAVGLTGAYAGIRQSFNIGFGLEITQPERINPSQMKIFYAGQIGQKGFGWATCNNGLFAELQEMGMAGLQGPDADVHFIPISDHDLNPSAPLRGRVNIGYTFFEYPLGPNAEENARKYDLIFCGSTWCKDRLAERGITNTEVLIQGVDHSIFHPRTPRTPDGRFRIFSGGKFEYRKGQDLVIAAFREFAKTHPEAHLVCAWHNPWPQLIFDMQQSTAIDMSGRHVQNDGRWSVQNQSVLFHRILIDNGIAPEQFAILPQLSQQELAVEMSNTDVGLFPNRCEGGTNLVLMEYAACGRPVVANTKTGHRDVVGVVVWGIEAQEDENHWAQQSVKGVFDCILGAHKQWADDPAPLWCRTDDWTWKSAAQKIIAAAERLSLQPA